jgi:hypothetical protein
VGYQFFVSVEVGHVSLDEQYEQETLYKYLIIFKSLLF